MANAKSSQDLLVWQKAMDLVVECYRHTRAFPQSEQFGLTMQAKLLYPFLRISPKATVVPRRVST